MSEHQIQSAFIEWVRLAEKQDERLELLFAVPNGGKRNPITGYLLKKEGVKKGVPDIVLPVKNSIYCGLMIEFKEPTKGIASGAQLRYSKLVTKYGWYYKICTDAEVAINAVKHYLASAK
jgi:hypothetical protein